jgi:hypothetical protein
LWVAPYARGSVVTELCELGQVGLADEDEPGGREALGEPCRCPQPVDVFSTCMPQWNGSPAVWHTPSLRGTHLGTVRPATTSAARGERLLVETMDDRIELRVELLVRDSPSTQLRRRRDITGPDGLGLRRGVPSAKSSFIESSLAR